MMVRMVDPVLSRSLAVFRKKYSNVGRNFVGRGRKMFEALKKTSNTISTFKIKIFRSPENFLASCRFARSHRYHDGPIGSIL